MPTPGRFTVVRCEKSPYFRTSSYLEYGGEGGIDSLRSPLRGSPLTAFAVCPTGCASCRTPVGGSHPPRTENIKEKSPYFRTSSHLEYGGEGGIDSLRSPLRGSPLTAFAVCPTGCASCRTPVGGSHPPRTENIKEKSPYFRTSSHLEYGGEGGIDSLRSPLRGSPLTAFAVCPTGCASCRTPVGGSHPPRTENIKEKSPYFRTSSHLEYGGEGGIRTPDTLPYTHFPGVLLQPLGHLTILSCCSPWVGNGALL